MGDQTWAPYQEVTHLITMDRYCKLMGVEGPNKLPAAYHKQDWLADILVNVAWLGKKDIRPGVIWESTHQLPPSMTKYITHKKWDKCVEFSNSSVLFCLSSILVIHIPMLHSKYIDLHFSVFCSSDFSLLWGLSILLFILSSQYLICIHNLLSNHLLGT